MKRFLPVPPPADFDARARQPGLRWLEEHPGSQRPRDYWSPFRPALANAFGQLCAYSVMYIPDGTVDHFVSIDEDRSLAYDWHNYRFAAGWINAVKSNLPARQLLDPFHVESSWFEILLPSMQLVPTPHVPPEFVQHVRFVLDRLCLGHDERIIRQRRMWYKMYLDGDLSLQGLAELAPLIADAVRRDIQTEPPAVAP